MMQTILTLAQAKQLGGLNMPPGVALIPAPLVDGTFALPADAIDAPDLAENVRDFLAPLPKRSVDLANEATQEAFATALNAGWRPMVG